MIANRSGTLDNSKSSSTGNAENCQTKHYVKELLRSRIFLGRYIERRLIDERIGYRDMILISNAEVDLKRDLLDAQQRLKVADPIHWIGITAETESAGVSIWTEIDNQPFGAFWFQIKKIKFREEETIILLKPLRHLNEAFLELEPILTKGAKKVITANGNLEFVLDSSTVTLEESYRNIIETAKSVLTVRNVSEFITFIFAFIIAVFSGSTAFISFLGNFVLALIRETSILVKTLTPIMLGFMEFLSKIVGGFYLLIAMIFKPNMPTPFLKRRLPPQNNPSYPQYYD